MIVNQAAASSPVYSGEAVSGFQQEPAPTVEVQQEQVVNPGAGQQAQFAQGNSFNQTQNSTQFAQSQEAYQAQGQFQQSAQAGNFQQGSSQSYNQLQGKKKKTAALWAFISMGAYFIYRGDTLLGLLILIPELVSSVFVSDISVVGLILLIVVNLAASILGYFVVMSSEAGSFLHQDAQGREMLD